MTREPKRATRERLLARIQQDWAAFHSSFQSLSDAELLQPGVVDDWSLRDLLVHITSWEEEALKAIPVILAEKPLPRYSNLYGGIDAFNAQEQERKEHLPLPQVKSDLLATHQRLVAYLLQLPEAAFASGGRLARRLRQDTCNHYREHTTHVVEWCERRSA